MVPSENRRSVAVPALVLALLAASCSVQEATPLPQCTGGGSVLIAAQSVPSAQMLPCFAPLPSGWEVEAVDITQSGMTIRFYSDRAGRDAASLVFAETCDVTGAVEQPNSQEAVEHFTLTDREEPAFLANSFLVFEGGCVTWSFEFDGDRSSSGTNELAETMSLVRRSGVRDDLAASFIDREL